MPKFVQEYKRRVIPSAGTEAVTVNLCMTQNQPYEARVLPLLRTELSLPTSAPLTNLMV